MRHVVRWTGRTWGVWDLWRGRWSGRGIYREYDLVAVKDCANALNSTFNGRCEACL